MVRRYLRPQGLAVTFPVFLLAFLLAFSPARATKVRPLNLEQMTARAERIFSGRCIEVQTVRDGDLGREVTLATFAVERAVKGALGPTVTIKLLGGQSLGTERGAGVVGLPRFGSGEEVVLFLYGESTLGLTSPVGLDQGKFSVYEDKLGRKLAVNRMGNRNLFGKLTPAAREHLGPVAAEWSDREAIPAGTLLDLVESLEHLAVSVPPQSGGEQEEDGRCNEA